MHTIDQPAAEALASAHGVVWVRAREHPDATAIVDVDGTEICYAEFADRCDRLAVRLGRLGIRPDEPIVVQLDRSAQAIIAMVAVMRAGGAYTPIDPSYPAARFAAIVRHLRARWLITDRKPPAQVIATGLRVVERDGPVPPSAAAPPVPHPDNLAYILHTSGSTGVPKGVAMTHRGLDRLISWQAGDGTPGLTTAIFTAAGFDVTFQEVFSTLATGGRLCMLSEADRRDPERLLDVLDRRSIQRIFMPYVALQRLAKAAQRTGRVPAALRHVIAAGERLVITDAIAELFDALPGCRLDNHYGPTETHLATSWTADEHNKPWPSIPPIGGTVSGARIYLLDDELEPAPVGEQGEIYVSGEAPARGYTNAPALTAERFLPDPFALVDGARMYRTGDLALMDATGVLHFLGRSDGQLKVRGYRVEPGEVEKVLSGHPGVRDVAVGLRRLADEVDGLVAYVVPEERDVEGAALSELARGALPPYMVPSRYVFLDALPLTSSGKVDRTALAEVALPVTEAGEAAGSTADTVAGIWARVLGHDEFEPDDDFFDIGGDSLLATWVIAELGQVFGRELPLSMLLEDSTVEGLAATLSELGTRSAGAHSASQILTLGAGRSSRALFMFHALGGEVFAYRELSRRLTSPLRVLGVRWADEGYGGRSIQDLARYHADQIRTVQPHGPYLLGGWSFGGVVAFEVAHRLVQDGERVDFLGLVDANPVLDPITGLPQEETTYADMLTRVLEQIEQAADDRPVDVSALVADEGWVGLMGGAAPTGLTAGHLKRHLSLAREGMRAVMDYRPSRYGGPVELFQADETAPEVQRRLAARLCESVAGPVGVHPVPGDHAGLLRGPNAAALAEAIDGALTRLARRRTDGES